MKITKKTALYSALGLGLCCVSGAVCYVWNYRMPMKESPRRALYMAVLDDEISRLTWEGQEINGKPVVFPHRSKSLQYRYHLFLELNRKKSRSKLRGEIAQMEEMLVEEKEKDK